MGDLQSPLRRVAPSQARGERRVQAILDAAAALVADGGFEALSLSAVAERSNSAIGSLYRFFSSKEQLVAALVERLAADIEREPAFDNAPDVRALAAEAFVTWYVRALQTALERHPAIAPLLHHLGDRCAALEARALAPVDRYLRANWTLRAAERSVVARFALELAVSAASLPARDPNVRLAAAMRELQVALTAYFIARLGPAPSARSKTGR